MATLNVKGIVIHCTASKWGDAAAVRRWHRDRGWNDIGYHGVILNGFRTYEDISKRNYHFNLDGKIEPGREDNVRGAHCLAEGMNLCTLGVSMVGNPGWKVPSAVQADIKVFKDPDFAYATKAQVDALIHYLAVKCKRYNLDPKGKFKHNGKEYFVISQHSDHDKGKPFCASMNVALIRDMVAAKLKETK